MTMFKIYALDEHTKSLPTVDTASGGVATFNTDLTENLVEVKCQIVAKQEGSGTPSPDNERPITTYTEIDVSVCGKNLLDTRIIIRNITSERQVLQNYPMKQGTYCFSFEGVNNGSVVGYFNIESQYEPNVRIDIPVGANGRLSGTITLTQDQNIGILCNGAAVGYNYKVSDIQIERGSQPTEFVANGTSKRIFFNQTVANGVFNMSTGKLKVTWAEVDLGDLSWTRKTDGAIPYFRHDFTDSSLTQLNRAFLCSNYPNVTFSDIYTNGQDKASSSYSGGIFIISDTDYSDTIAFTTAMRGVQLIYELATPIEIQLDSTQIQALLNENNIWCDTGDTEVKYLLSVGKKIA